jgi:hypothetical protein
MQRVTTVARVAFHMFAGIAAALPVAAQETGALDGLGLRNGSDLPGLGRVVVVLLVTLALAVAVAFALRRFWPQAAQQTGGALRLRAQLSLSSHLKLHFVEAGRTTVIVAEGRSGIAIAELGAETQPPASNGGGDAK